LPVTELARGLVSWIKEVVLAAGSEGVVLGMSGGLDSSVVAALCQRAFPGSTVGVIMPCHSDALDEEHARLVADKFHISTRTVVVDDVFDALIAALRGETRSAVPKLAESNIKPRLRMTILYYFANQLGYLVAGTSNKSEISVGYFTKHGDNGVDLLPLGNLVKSQVRDLALHLGIPQEIIDKPPSAGLWKGQSDEAELGLTYSDIDRYLVSGEARGEVKVKIDSMMARSGSIGAGSGH